MGRETPYGDALFELEQGISEHDCRVDEGIAKPYVYTKEHFRACLRIFMAALLWKMWEYNMPVNAENIEEKSDLAEKMGQALKEIVLEFTGIDTFELY